MPPEFNVEQQAFLERRAAGKPWAWSALRPSVVCGLATGIPMNLTMVIAIYATIAKRLGVPLRFPGKPGAYSTLLEVTDADLLARAMVWAATDPRAANQAFNINNGDLFRWEEMWPKLAGMFSMQVAPGLPMSLATVMADKGPVWDAIVAEHGLVPTPYEEVSSWAFGDAVFGWDYDLIADGSKARRLGFHEYVETESMFASLLKEMRARRLIP
jgi:nucleoside-diphosphate-sugar epimerase